MTRTRLINLRTFKLQEYVISRMPPYIAVSHVWAEALFPSTATGSMKDTMGMKLVNEALAQIQQRDPLMSLPRYCWIDTWCIDQNDDQDKHIQIPAMGDIYKGAEMVIIVTNHCFSFSQNVWEEALGKVKPVFMAYFQYFQDPSGALVSFRSIPQSVIATFGSLTRMLAEVASIPWSTRIWTAQEYILARSQCWIGANKKLLSLAENDMDYISRAAELFRQELGVDKLLSEQQWRMLSMPQNVHLIKSGDASPLKAMSLAANRQCLMPKDQIYGLMGAAGVVIKHETRDTLEAAWKKWCEAAILRGHIDIICTAAMRSPSSFLDDAWNCATPTWKDRCDILQQSYLPTSRSEIKTSIHKGTINMPGIVAGVCVIEKYLSNCGLPVELEDLAAICGENLVLAEKVCFAEDGGIRPEQEVKERAKAIHAAYIYTTKSRLTGEEEIKLQQMIDTFSAGLISRSGFGTHAYLARLVNNSNSRDILVFTDEDLYEDEELLALDLTSGLKTEPHPLTQLVVARPPPKPGNVLHKAGMTSWVKIHTTDQTDVEQCGCEGYVHTETVRELGLGGSACWYCKEVKKVSTSRKKTASKLLEEWSTDHIESGNYNDWCTIVPETEKESIISTVKARISNGSRTWFWLLLSFATLAYAYWLRFT